MKSRKTNNRRRMRPRGRSAGDSLARKSYLRQNPAVQLVTLQFPLKITKVSLAASSSFSLAIDVDAPSDILDSDAATIVGKFAEWRVVKVNAELVPLSTTAGSSAFWFNEEQAGVSPAAVYKSATSRKFPNTNAQPSKCRLSWSPADFSALEFWPTNANSTLPLFNFYGYTNLADFGTPSSTVDLWTLTGTVTVEVRGLST